MIGGVIRGLTACVLLAAGSQAQEIWRSLLDGATPPAIAPGTGPGSLPLSEMESINPFSGSLAFTVPLASAGGRGEVAYPVHLPLSTRWIVNVKEIPGPPGEGTTVILYPTEVGLRGMYGTPILERRDGEEEIWCGGSPMLLRAVTRLHWLAGDGSDVELVDAKSNGTPQPSGLTCFNNSPTGTALHYNREKTFVSKDGSTITFVSDDDIFDETPAFLNGTLYYKNGIRYRIENGNVQWISDRHGNLISVHYQTGDPSGRPVAIDDPLGRRITIDYGNASNHPDEDWTTYGGVQGNRKVIVRYSRLENLLANDVLTRLIDLFPAAAHGGLHTDFHNPRLPSEVELPDARKFSFRYNRYGELARVTLPTGGVVEYTWTGYTSDGKGLYGPLLIYRRVSARRVYDADGATLLSQTTYSVPVLHVGMPSDLVVTTTESDSGGTSLRTIERHFRSNPLATSTYSGVTYPGWREGREMLVRNTQGLTSFQTVLHTWGQRGPTNSTIVPSSESTPPNDPRVTVTSRSIGFITSYTTYGYSVDEHNNLTWLCDWDFEALSPSRCKFMTYVTNTSYTAPPVHLRGLILSEAIQTPGMGGFESTVTYEYDNYGGTGLTSYANISQHDPARAASFTARGNVTKETRLWTMGLDSTLITTIAYDIAGNAVSVTIPKIIVPGPGLQTGATSFSFTDQFDNGVTGKDTYAFPTTITDAEGMTQNRWYHWPAGVLLRSRDRNNQDTTYSYVDPLDRLTAVTPPIGRTEYVYNDAARQITTMRRQNGAQWVTSTIDYDGLGRTIRTRLNEGGTEIRTDTEYGALGRVKRVSNPARGTPSEWTVPQYDALDRVTLITHPDNSLERFCYSNNETIHVDAGEKFRRLTVDGMGRLTSVVEDADGSCQGITRSGGANHQTTYSYNARDLLRFVTQGSQTREFRYDELGRLRKSIQPENGTIDYNYDGAGNLMNIVTNGTTTLFQAYDKLGRVRMKYDSVTLTPAATYCYDGNTNASGCSLGPSGANLKGQLTMVSNSKSTVKYSAYDPIGRVTAHQVSIAGQANPFNFSYEYNDLALTAMVYPSGRRVSNGYDAAGRITSATGLKEGVTTNYVSNASYAPHGGFSTLQIGGVRTEQWCYNSRMQPMAMRVGASVSTNCGWTAGDLLRLGYTYGPVNNGNLQSQTIMRPSYTATQSYSYDGLNRLKSFSEGPGWTRSHSYNQWGNMWVSVNSGFGLSSFTPVSGFSYNSQNRLLANGYDFQGNLATIGAYTFTYDHESRMTSSTINGSTTTYAYDGEGRRVKKGSTVYVYDAFGNLAAEYGGTAGAGGTTYLVQDHLGSTRLQMTAAGAEEKCLDYEPFGEQLDAGVNGRGNCYASAGGNSIRFTGKERDAETASSAMQGLDYFGARYYAGAQGRFTSPDKLNVTDDRLLVPSTLNKYAYAANNPLRFIDPDGRDVVALLDPPHGGRPGHFAIFAHNPNTNQAAFMSFGPMDQSFSGQLLTLTGGSVASTVSFGMPKSADDLRRDYTALSIQTSPEQAQEVINFINRFRAAENPYQLLQTNCSTVCRDALKAIGLLPRNYRNIMPFGLWSTLYGRFSNPLKQRFSTTTRYGEQFRSLRIDSQRGVDYGNPRFGMNTFDFIMLMLRPKEEVKSRICYTGEDGKQVCQ